MRQVACQLFAADDDDREAIRDDGGAGSWICGCGLRPGTELRGHEIHAVRIFIVGHGARAFCSGQRLDRLVAVGGVDDAQRAVSVRAEGKLMFWVVPGSIRTVSNAGGRELLACFGGDDCHLLAIAYCEETAMCAVDGEP